MVRDEGSGRRGARVVPGNRARHLLARCPGVSWLPMGRCSAFAEWQRGSARGRALRRGWLGVEAINASGALNRPRTSARLALGDLNVTNVDETNVPQSSRGVRR